ncbi:hypothetical protein VF13_36775, partial [Nostoc linckia z16]
FSQVKHPILPGRRRWVQNPARRPVGSSPVGSRCLSQRGYRRNKEEEHELEPDHKAEGLNNRTAS